MKKISVVIFMGLFVWFTAVSNAQSNPSLMCGDTISDYLSTDNLSHTYSMDVEVGTTLIIHSLPISSPIDLTVDVLNANGAYIGANDFSPEESPAIIETSEILSSGTYQVIVSAAEAGDYQLFVSCVADDGTVTSDNNQVTALTCGDQVDNTMTSMDELHRYFLYLETDTVMDVFLESLYGEFGDMKFELGLFSPTNQELDRINEDFKDIERNIFEQNITSSGIYRLYVQGYDGMNENYRLSIDCTLPNGNLALADSSNRRVLEPTQLSAPETTAISATPAGTELSEMVMYQDLIEGLPNTGQIADSETLVAYLFTGEADETIRLIYADLRGDSQLDLWVQDPNENTIFSSSLLLADELSVDLTLPESGDYVIYLSLSDTSQEADAVFTIEVIRGE